MNVVAEDTYAPCPNPDCNGEVEVLAGTEVGEMLVCDECGVDTEVIDIDSEARITLEMIDEAADDF